jgi:hypothetical protein
MFIFALLSQEWTKYRKKREENRERERMINELAEKVLCKQLLYKPNTNTIKTNTVKASFDFSGRKPLKNFFKKII